MADSTFAAWLGNLLGGSGGQPTGYSGLTPDQTNMVNQVGYFMNPDAIAPQGSGTTGGMPYANGQWTQPTGYSGLNPSQIQAVQNQGYFTNPDAVQPQSLMQQLASKLGSPGMQNALSQLGKAATPQPAGPPQPPMQFQQMPRPFTGFNPNNIFQRPSTNPAQAYQNLQAGLI